MDPEGLVPEARISVYRLDCRDDHTVPMNDATILADQCSRMHNFETRLPDALSAAQRGSTELQMFSLP